MCVTSVQRWTLRERHTRVLLWLWERLWMDRQKEDGKRKCCEEWLLKRDLKGNFNNLHQYKFIVSARIKNYNEIICNFVIIVYACLKLILYDNILFQIILKTCNIKFLKVLNKEKQRFFSPAKIWRKKIYNKKIYFFSFSRKKKQLNE